MSYFRTRPICGANLDPGERCDCAAVSDKGALRMRRAPCGCCAIQKNTAHGEATPKAAGNQHIANHIIAIIQEGVKSVNGLHA